MLSASHEECKLFLDPAAERHYVKRMAKLKRDTEALEYLFMVFLEKSARAERALIWRIFSAWEADRELPMDHAIAQILQQRNSEITQAERFLDGYIHGASVPRAGTAARYGASR
jgi:hypothetical protein